MWVPLSRQISALEHDLGTQLFDRDRRGTELTQAGQRLLEDAVPLLAAASALDQRTRLAGRDLARFAVGFMPGIHATPITREFAQRAPARSAGVARPGGRAAAVTGPGPAAARPLKSAWNESPSGPASLFSRRALPTSTSATTSATSSCRT
jgi:DNA-binding transcriptional LysR family regulator